jgi:hypothetical protein
MSNEPRYLLKAIISVAAEDEAEAQANARQLCAAAEKLGMGWVVLEADGYPVRDRPDDGPRFGDVELAPYAIDPETGEKPAGVERLDRLADGAYFEDAEGRCFNVVRQGPTQGSTEIVDDDGTHAYYDCGALVLKGK